MGIYIQRRNSKGQLESKSADNLGSLSVDKDFGLYNADATSTQTAEKLNFKASLD